MLAYNEQGKDSPLYITEDEAIKRMRQNPRVQAFIDKGNDYTDADALKDFMAIYWAWKTNEKSN